MIQEGAKRVSAAGAVVADAPFGPAPIIDGVVGLHRGDHVQLGEAIEILGRHVLRVFNAEAAVALAVGLHDLAVQIENDRNALVADGVRAKLQAGGVGSHHAVLHQRNRMHFVGEQAVVVGLVAEGFEEVCGGRSQGAVGVGLERADAKIGAAKGVPDADFDLIIDAR